MMRGLFFFSEKRFVRLCAQQALHPMVPAGGAMTLARYMWAEDVDIQGRASDASASF